MIVYREQRRRVLTVDVLRRIVASQGLEREIELGELHAGVADAFCPDCDRDTSNAGLPEEIEVSVPEGFAYYALDPELYRMAARRFAAADRPSAVYVIGIRSIGTTLGEAVANELKRAGIQTRFATVRPRGHPFDRQLRVDYDLARQWLGWNGHFAIVDEGPGISGSSFASVAGYLAALGIAEDRVALFPSHDADPAAFVSEAARQRWPRHRRYVVEFEELGRFADARDLSAGLWRKLRRVCPPAQPQHERRKYLRGDRLYKFSGFGRYGKSKVERAARLTGFIPPVLELENGFLATRWVEGRSVRASRGLMDFAARYLARIAREFPTGEPADTATLAAMIEQNTGRAWTGQMPEAGAVLLDGRMLPHEWLETASGYVKTDALDHHDDHFFPGPQDIAWDVAAFSLEFGCGDTFVDRYQAESGDRGVGDRVPFYRAAYLAFRYGYCDLAAQALGGHPDAGRFRRAADRYCALIAREPWAMKTGRLSA